MPPCSRETLTCTASFRSIRSVGAEAFLPLSVVEETLEPSRDCGRRRYEAAVDFQGLWKSAVIALLSGAKRESRLGQALAA